MSNGLTTASLLGQSVASPLFAQFGGSKNYYVDLLIIVVLIGLVIFVVGRASRRY